MTEDEIKADLALIKADRASDSLGWASTEAFNIAARARWPLYIAEVRRLTTLADKYHQELQWHWTAELDAKAEVQRLESELAGWVDLANQREAEVARLRAVLAPLIDGIDRWTEAMEAIIGRTPNPGWDAEVRAARDALAPQPAETEPQT